MAKNENENTTIQKSMGCSKSSSNGEVYSDTSVPQETRKSLNKQPNLIPKGTGKRKMTKIQN